MSSNVDNVILMVGVDTEVYHGFVNCGSIETDELTTAQRCNCEDQYTLFRAWFADWSKLGGIIAECA